MTVGRQSPGLGTFGGVFTPSILTILGIILFLRLTYIVGNAGLLHALAIIGIANSISILTSFSLAGISTHLRVKGGGDYYLISRTLGLGYGGAIGIIVFAAQSISVGFYCIGFAEAAAGLAGLGHPAAQLIAAITAAILMALAWLGSDWATRFQYGVMAFIALALISFAVGADRHWDFAQMEANLAPNGDSPPFWTLFAVFFPAVTGFTQGVSMSGDLRNPERSIPLGTFVAVLLSFAIYIGVAVLAAGALPQQELATDYRSMARIAAWPALITAGIFAATLSSALASFMGAPRILQSLSKDRIFPMLKIFAHGSGASNNPRRAIALTGMVALMVVALGDLNLVASIVSMFFLVSYGLLNYATYFEARSRSPSFRPRFSLYHERISLCGALACFGAMLAIDVAAGAIATAMIGGIYLYLRARGVPARWADSRRSYHLQQAREHILAAARAPEHARDWRPQLLVFSDDSERRGRLLRFASWIEGGAGLTTVIKVLESDRPEVSALRKEAAKTLEDEITQQCSSAFPLVIAARTLEDGIAVSIQAVGLGPVNANTVVVNLGAAKDGAAGIDLNAERYGYNLRVAFHLGCNLLVLSSTNEKWAALLATKDGARSIDIWWTEGATSPLALVLAHLMTRSDEWSDARIRVLVAGGQSGARIERVRKILNDSHIEAEALAVERFTPDNVAVVSGQSSLVFLPMTMPIDESFHVFGYAPASFLEGPQLVVFVLSAEDIELTSDPDQGPASEIALAADRLADAAQTLSDLDRKTLRLERRLRKMREELAASDSGTVGDRVQTLQADLEILARRRAAARKQLSQAEIKMQEINDHLDR
ncbi:MAG: amino acid permease [Rhodospirillaceae bacterium]|nr:amino acid permease [Rhodospirillaceae bacterium]